MANDCLITKEKSVVNNDNLKELGSLKFRVHTLSESNLNTQRLQIASNGVDSIKVKTLGTGKCNFVYENLYTQDIKEVQWSGSGLKSVFLSNGDYYLTIIPKYPLSSLAIPTCIDTSETPIFLSELAYSHDLINLNCNMAPNSSRSSIANGDISALKNCIKIQELSLEQNKSVFGDIISLSKLTQIKILHLYGTGVNGTVESFVQGQYSNGRATVTESDSIKANHILQYISFGGRYFDRAYSYITWQSPSKITIYSGATSSTAIADCSHIYAKGATAEEIAAWEQAGKNVTIIE